MSQPPSKPTETKKNPEGGPKSEESGPSEPTKTVEVVEETVVQQNVSENFYMIAAPKHCPPGYRLDSKGKMKRIM